MKSLRGDKEKWKKISEKFVSDGYDDINQAKLARVSDLLTMRVYD